MYAHDPAPHENVPVAKVASFAVIVNVPLHDAEQLPLVTLAELPLPDDDALTQVRDAFFFAAHTLSSAREQTPYNRTRGSIVAGKR